MTGARPKVLIVEDAAYCATTLEIALQRNGSLEVRVVGSAEEARHVLATERGISALVTDVHLPDASGLDLVRWVRSRDSSVRLPIIVITGDSDPDTDDKAIRLGADAYFAKPFSPSEVRQKLEVLIHAAGKTDLH